MIIIFFYVNNIIVLNKKENYIKVKEFIKLFYKKYKLRRLKEIK
jgi:hypothetical protein